MVPLRSVLYVPGSNARALEKARTLPCDAVIVDLEDAVAPSAKEAARARAIAAIVEGGWGHRVTALRVNGDGTPWAETDLAAAAEAGLAVIVLPKVERPETVLRADRALAQRAELWAMIETPRGVLALPEIAAASPRMTALVAGTSDLGKELRARHTPDRRALLTSLGLLVLAARARGLAALDGVHLDLDDEEGFVEACRQGRDLGFDGKTLIHPRTIDVANRVFAPDDEELAHARRVIEAHAAANARGEGVTVLDGKLVEGLHVEQAQRIVAVREVIAGR